MPALSKEMTQELISKIRMILVRKPDATCREVEEIMKKNNIDISYSFANKLIKKIRKERAVRYDYAAKNIAIAKFEDFLKMIELEWMKLKDSTNVDVVRAMALTNIVKNYKMLLDLQFDMGIFERNLGKIKNENTSISAILKEIKITQKKENEEQNPKRISNDDIASVQ